MNKLSCKNKYKNIAIISLIAIFFIGDRLLKFLSYQYFQEKFEVLPLIGNWFYFSFAKNYKIAFSLPFSGPWLLFLTAIIILIIAFVVLKLLWRDKTISQQVALLVLILTGAVSNFIDRFSHGYVIDYFAIKNLAVFNLADTMIGLGSLLLIIIVWRAREDKKEHSL